MKKLFRLFISQYTIYLAISVILYILFTLNIDKYKVSLISTERSGPIKLNYYIDLNHDGNSEKVIFQQYPKHTAVIVYTKGKIIDQWNFNGVGATTSLPFFTDYDDDGIKEIFVFTLHNDSIYMHCLDALNRKIKIENKAICKAYKARGVYDFTINPSTAHDVNADGYKEIFFSIFTTYSTHPRNMFAYYPVQDTILESPESCTNPLHPIIYDLDRDNIPEFICNTMALGNCSPNRKYSDQYCWFIVYTPKMKFKFPPIPFDAYPAYSQFIPFNTGKKSHILALHIYRGTENYPSFLALFNSNGKIVRKKNIDVVENWYYATLFSKNDDYKEGFLLKKNGEVYQIDDKLNMNLCAKLENIAPTNYVQKIDIDYNGEDEYIFRGKSKKEIIIYRNNFSNPATLKFIENIDAYQMSIIEKEGMLPKIFVDTDEYSYTFAYHVSVGYKYRYILFIISYLFVLFFHFVIQKIRHYRELKISDTQNRIAELQIKSIQTQLDPHFTFNVMASFNNLINEKDTERANFIFSSYIRLLRSTVLNADNVCISLAEEIDFTENYLKLEKFRYSNKFSYRLDVTKQIDKQMPIPKMIMHLFVENAIKHGLKHRGAGGELKIDATRKNGIVQLSIKDNGIGRKKAKEYSGFSTGKGLGIMDQILEHYYKLNKIKITYKIIDLYDENKAAGTEVKIRIPIGEGIMINDNEVNDH